MAQSFYTRDEAASILGITPEELDQMRTNNQLTGGIEQGGAWKFPVHTIEELARNRPSAFDSSSEFDPGSSGDFTLSTEGSNPQMISDSSMGSSEFGSSEMGSAPGMGSMESATGSDPEIGSDPDIGSDLDISLGDQPPPVPAPATSGLKNPSVIKLAAEESLDFGAPPPPATGGSMKGAPSKPGKGASQVVPLGDAPAGGASPSMKGPASKGKPSGESDVRLDMDTGSFEFSLSVDSSGRLGDPAKPASAGPGSGPKTGDKPPSSQRLQGLDAGDDSDVRLDFDPGATSPDDDLINVGKPDSDIRIDPVSEVRGGRSGGLAPPPGGDLMETEQIDLDAELRRADEASLAKHPPRATPAPPRTKATPVPPGPSSLAKGKTQAPAPPTPTMLPTTSPFELSEEDIDVGSLSGGSSDVKGPLTKPGGGSGRGMHGGGSEFELTLAPEDEGGPRTNPLKLGDDEDVDLGGPLPPSESPSRAEMSGINLQVPADSGISLEKKKKTAGGGGGDDAVDFELTIDEDGASGPKTLRGKLTDSDSEFELTLDEGSSTSLPKVGRSSGLDSSGEQKDIFETDFDLQAAGMEESGSQAVPLDEADTDLESSDFDLAIEDADSGSQVVPLDEDTSSLDAGAPRPKSKVSKADDLSGVDSYADEDLLATEDRPAEEQLDEEPAPITVPAAQAEWGIYPLIMMVPCVLIMIMAMLMSYELVHSMWGYHASSKPTGLLVDSFAKMFTDDAKQ